MAARSAPVPFALAALLLGLSAVSAAPFSSEIDYDTVIGSLGELPASGVSPNGYVSSVPPGRRHQIEERVRGIQHQIMHLTKMPCVPRAPYAPYALHPEFLNLLNRLLERLQNDTHLDRQNLLKRAQSFYPSCDPPEGLQDMYTQHGDSMNVYFNLSSFFITEPEEVIIEMAELQLYKLAQPNYSSQMYHWMRKPFDDLDDEIRVSVYSYLPAVAGGELDLDLVDTVTVPLYGAQWVTLNVSSAVSLWGDGEANLGLRVTVQDMRGARLRAHDFFEKMDCNDVPESGPLPGYLLRKAKELDIEVTLPYHYPVLDVSTAEPAGPTPMNGVVPSTELCPETPRLANRHLPYITDGGHRHHRRRHHRHHHRRHQARGHRHRGQH